MTHAASGMPCPVCKVPLVMSDRQGVEIDYCQQCRGVWLDRGELDKIIERSANDGIAASPAMPIQKPRESYGHQAGYGYGHPKRRKSFLEELFD